MDKLGMRDWVCSLEEAADIQLRKWSKVPKVENGEAVQMRWVWDQTHIHMDIFWENEKELVHLKYFSPRAEHDYKWHGLNNNTFNKIMDRVGNLAQITMHPPIDWTDPKD